MSEFSGPRTSTSILPNLFRPDLAGRRYARLWFQSLASSIVGLIVCVALGLENPGFASVFLVSVALADRCNALLAENRANILDRHMPSGQANRLTAFSLLAMFAGIVVAYIAAALHFGATGVESAFGFALDAAQLHSDTLLTRRFDSFVSIAGHNFVVLMCVAVLSFIYRATGALFAIAWNACVWGYVVTVLVWRGTEATQMPSPAFVAIAATALFPHLVLEGFAYVLAALAAVYMSKALFQYALTHPIMRPVAMSSLRHLGLGVLCLLAAAAFEAFYAPPLLDLLR